MICVNAEKINEKQFTFKCPICWSRYKKNGQPSKTAKRIYHRHGSAGNLNNRIEFRTHHNSINGEYCEFKIKISDNTLRI